MSMMIIIRRVNSVEVMDDDVSIRIESFPPLFSLRPLDIALKLHSNHTVLPNVRVRHPLRPSSVDRFVVDVFFIVRLGKMGRSFN